MLRPEASTFSGQCDTRAQRDTAQKSPRKQVCPVPWDGGPELPKEVLSLVYPLLRFGHQCSVGVILTVPYPHTCQENGPMAQARPTPLVHFP